MALTLQKGGDSLSISSQGVEPACQISGTVTGTIVPADIVGPEPQGVTAGEFEEPVAAIRAGVTCVSVHTALHPSGEIRGQIK